MLPLSVNLHSLQGVRAECTTQQHKMASLSLNLREGTLLTGKGLHPIEASIRVLLNFQPFANIFPWRCLRF